MIEIRMTKELGDFEPKVIGPFTMRQSICLLIGAPICYMIIRFLSPILTIDVAAFFCTIPAGIAYAFGWAKPYGMRMEKFLSSVFINRVVAPSIRKYKVKNTHEKLLYELEQLSDDSEIIGTANKKKTRYKLSKEAWK